MYIQPIGHPVNIFGCEITKQLSFFEALERLEAHECLVICCRDEILLRRGTFSSSRDVPPPPPSLPSSVLFESPEYHQYECFSIHHDFQCFMYVYLIF